METKYFLYFLTGGVVVSVVTYFASHLPRQERHILFLTINEIFHIWEAHTEALKDAGVTI